MKIWKIIKGIIYFFYSWAVIAGFMFVTCLAIGSIYILKTGNEYHYDLDLGIFVKNSDMANFWLICWCCFVLYFGIKLVSGIVNGVKKIKQGNKKEGVWDILKEFVKN